MNILKIIILISSISLLNSFGSDSNTLGDKLFGTWVYSNYDNKSIQFKKERSFDDKKPGIKFMKNGTLVKRQNSGWCGTPPISYKNFEGTWKTTSDSTLNIRYKYWGGTIEEDWLIIDLSNKVFTVKSLEQRKEKDY
ncbi:MAG: hypothetical protein AB8F94_20980 [Saprospiraceae bacterium]